jgi:hypothetical protein
MSTTWDTVSEGMEIPTLAKNCNTQQLVNFAEATGLENIIVHGALKHAFLGQLLHDWIGNEGSIKKVGCSYRGMDFPDQDIQCKGIVTRKYEENGEKLVDLEIWTENPDGQRTSPGVATVQLP